MPLEEKFDPGEQIPSSEVGPSLEGIHFPGWLMGSHRSCSLVEHVEHDRPIFLYCYVKRLIGSGETTMFLYIRLICICNSCYVLSCLYIFHVLFSLCSPYLEEIKNSSSSPIFRPD